MGWEVSLKKKKLIKVILGNKRCKTSHTFISSIDGMNILISFKFLSDVYIKDECKRVLVDANMIYLK